jgi:hypothetical protein
MMMIMTWKGSGRFRLASWNFPRWIEENHKNPFTTVDVPDENLNRASPSNSGISQHFSMKIFQVFIDAKKQ